jgi:hypothetical protein
MLYTTDVALWLANLPSLNSHFPTTPQLTTDQRAVVSTGGDLPITFDRYSLPDDSGQKIELHVESGGSTENERTVDVHFLSLMIFGNPDDHTGVEHLVSSIDDALMGTVPPLDIPPAGEWSTTRLISLDYTGGPPRFVTRDQPGMGARSVFAAEYLVRVARTVF